MAELNKPQIERLFELLNQELRLDSASGELYLVGGAVMCLVHQSRPATRDVDAAFAPTAIVRAAAQRVAQKADVPTDWLNDAVKGFFSDQAEFNIFVEHSNLRVMVAKPEYLLAMKCLAMRIGEEFHDIADIRYLLRWLNIEHYDDALTVIAKYYPLAQFPSKTLYALEEILSESG